MYKWLRNHKRKQHIVNADGLTLCRAENGSRGTREKLARAATSIEPDPYRVVCENCLNVEKREAPITSRQLCSPCSPARPQVTHTSYPGHTRPPETHPQTGG
jgi:hypothetical protein